MSWKNKDVSEVRNAVEGADFIFVHQNSNWADEMDVHAYKVFTEGEFAKFLAKAAGVHFPVTRYYGTNEEDEYDSFEGFLYDLKVKPITNAEYWAFKSIFESDEAGNFWTPNCNYECDECEEEKAANAARIEELKRIGKVAILDENGKIVAEQG